MYKTILNDCIEIAEYIEEISPCPVDLEQIEEYFFGCKAILEERKLSEIRTDNEENSHLSDDLAKEQYKLLSIVTMPPIVVENNEIVDGHHRFNVLKYFGIEKIKVYDVIEIYETT